MAWFTTGDLDEFVAEAGGFLRARPVEHTVPLTILDTLQVRGRHAYGEADPWFGWWRAADGAVGSAFLRTPPHPVLLADVPDEAVPALVTLLAGVERISAARPSAEAFAAELRRRTGAVAEVHQQVRLYRLGELTPQDPPPPGRARLAGPGDRELLLSWFAAFQRELGEASRDLESVVDDRISQGGVTLWEADGAPVSMAGRTRPTNGMIRVAPVYTPAPLRRRGYAGAATAAVSRTAQALARDVLLMTDLANPTSNALYQRLGYRPVEDRLVLKVITTTPESVLPGRGEASTPV